MKTILIADNDSRVRNLVRLMFTESMGYRVVDTSSGREAVLKACTLKPDIVLANVSLSDKSGYEVSREIKNSPRIKGTAVILIADSYETFDESIAAEAHSDDFIIKPLRAEEVVNKLEPFFIRSKNKFNPTGLINRDKLKAFKSIPRPKIEGRVVLGSGIGALLVIFVLILSIVYRTHGVNLSGFELNAWFSDLGNIDLFRAVPESTVSDRVMKEEIISTIKEENTDINGESPDIPHSIAEAPVTSHSSSENRKSSSEQKGRVKVFGWDKKEASEKPESIEPKEEIPVPGEMPEEAVEGKRYVVKKGDSLWEIANSFDIPVDDIMAANGLKSDSLDVGNVLIIPATGKGGERLKDGGEGQARAESAQNRINPGGEVAKNGTTNMPANQHDESKDKTGTESAEVKGEIAQTKKLDIPAPTRSDGEYSVQVGAFQGEETAGRIAEELLSKGYPAFVRTVDDPRKGRWHMIRIGKFQTREEALAYGNEVNEKEAMVQEAIVVSEIERGRVKQVSQKPMPDELPSTIQEGAEMNDFSFGEMNRPNFEQEKSRILEEIKRSKVLKDIEEKVREKGIDEEPPTGFNANDRSTKNSSVLSQVGQ